MSDLSEIVARSYFATAAVVGWSLEESPTMSWRIAVRHRTGYHYETPARASYNEVRMTPATADGQHTLQSKRRHLAGGRRRSATSTTGARSCTPSTCTCRTPSWS